MNASQREEEDWIYLNHCIEDRDVGAIKQWFEPGTHRDRTKLQLFTNVRNPVSLAAVGGDEEIFDLLVSQGFDPLTPDLLDGVWQRKPIHLAVSSGHGNLATKLLTDYGVNVESRDETGRTPLHWAAITGQVELTRKLLAFGACVNAAEGDSSTPLHYAAEAGNGGVCKILMSNSADVNLKDNKGLSPLHYAVRSQPPSAHVPSSAVANHESLC